MSTRQMKPTTYKRKLKAYQETYLEFRYDSLTTTLKDNFNILDFNQYKIDANGEAREVQASALVELKGGDTTKEAMGEQTMMQYEEQATKKILVEQEEQHVFV